MQRDVGEHFRALNVAFGNGHLAQDDESLLGERLRLQEPQRGLPRGGPFLAIELLPGQGSQRLGIGRVPGERLLRVFLRHLVRQAGDNDAPADQGGKQQRNQPGRAGGHPFHWLGSIFTRVIFQPPSRQAMSR
ncbi:MAG: hypothetical protein KF811_15060 [Dokdonella sp.]|nr:hypothetical protein [Dokdonella sp.]